jgi:hypothetical protein
LAIVLDSDFDPDPEASVRRLLRTLAVWVLDLPASESNHHAYPFGLLDHLLEVAVAAAAPYAYWPGRSLQTTWWDHRVLRLLAVTGLLHDLGKVFNVEVRDPGSGDLWDPLREPLVYFKARHGLGIFAPTPFRFVKGRGVKAHEEQGQALIPLVLPSMIRKDRVWEKAAEEIVAASEAYVRRYDPPGIRRPAPMDYVADCVQRADALSTRSSQSKDSEPGGLLLELRSRVQGEASFRLGQGPAPENPLQRLLGPRTRFKADRW